MKLTGVLIIKRDTQIISQKNDLNSLLILDFQKRHVKLGEEFLRGNKEKMIRNQYVGHYLKGLEVNL